MTWIADHPDVGDSLTAVSREKDFQRRARALLADRPDGASEAHDLAIVTDAASSAHHEECEATYGRCTCAVEIAEAALRLLGLRVSREP